MSTGMGRVVMTWVASREKKVTSRCGVVSRARHEGEVNVLNQGSELGS